VSVKGQAAWSAKSRLTAAPERLRDIVLQKVKRNLIREAVEHFVADFASKELELACPGVSARMIRHVLREMQAEGKVRRLGERRTAKWRRVS